MDGYFYIPTKKPKRRTKKSSNAPIFVLKPPSKESFYIGEVTLGNSFMDIPKVTKDCETQIFTVEDTDILQLQMNDKNYDINLEIDTPFVHGLLATKIFHFRIHQTDNKVNLQIYFKSLPLKKLNGQSSKTVSALFAILFSINEVVKRKSKQLYGEHTVNQVYHQIRKRQIDNGLISQINDKLTHCAFLRTQLRAYQQQAVQWMLQVEASAQQIEEVDFPCAIKVHLPETTVFWNPIRSSVTLECPKVQQQFQGGILADEMGLGKTIELLALILADYSDPPRTSKNALKVQFHGRVARPKYKNPPIQQESISSPSKSYARVELQTFYDERVYSVNRRKMVHETGVTCVCGSYALKNLVKCSKCGKEQHAECMGFELSDDENYICPQCWISEDLIETNCTLLVCPTSLRQQWINEIRTHVQYPWQVLDYTETQDLAAVYPTTLAKYDIVLTTYTVLHGEFRKLDPEKEISLRKKKRYASPGCPFMLLKWKRICLDEAQMVENSNTMIAETACRMNARFRWAITGTPISKSISDLFGIIEFLRIAPFAESDVFSHLLYDKFEQGDKRTMIELLARVLWRTAKTDVLDQINLPTQSVRVHSVNFTHTERYFYDCELAESQTKFSQKLEQYSALQVVAALKAKELKDVLQPIVAVRRVCVHHAVVDGRYLVNKKPVNSLTELLDALIARNIHDTEDAIRMITSLHNGVAGIYQLQEYPSSAVHEYMKLIQLEESFKKDANLRLCIDKLPLIHMYYNLRQLVVKDASLAQILFHSNVVQTQYTPEMLAMKVQTLENEHIQKFVMRSKQCIAIVKEYAEKINELNAQINDESWFADVVVEIFRKKLKDVMLQRIANMLSNSGGYEKHFRPKESLMIESFMVWSTKFANARCQIVDLLNSLYEITPSGHIKIEQDLIDNAVSCHVRPAKKEKDDENDDCLMCQIHLLLKQYERIIFAEDQTRSQANFSWKQCFEEVVGRVILKVADRKIECQDAVTRGQHFFTMFDLVKKEFKELRKMWTELNFHICAFDELEQCKLKMKLKTTDSNARPPTARSLQQLSYEIRNHLNTINELDQFEMNDYLMRMQTEVNIYHTNLKQLLGTRNYLESLHNRNMRGQQMDPCPICDTQLIHQWTVLRCGHSFCMNCLDTQIARSKLDRQSNFTCAVCRQVQSSTDVNYIDNSVVQEEAEDEVAIKGNCSSKVAAIVKLVIALKKDDDDVKVILFSTWTPVLKVLDKVFFDNDINAKLLLGSNDMGNAVKFLRNKRKRVTVLLLPISQGSKGLTLIEATHIIFAEPLLDPSDELQAIGRIHRFGQNKETVVHKFIVRDTIEEEIHKATSAVDNYMWNKSELKLQQLRDLLFNNNASQASSDTNVET